MALSCSMGFRDNDRLDDHLATILGLEWRRNILRKALDSTVLAPGSGFILSLRKFEGQSRLKLPWKAVIHIMDFILSFLPLPLLHPASLSTLIIALCFCWRL